MAYNASLPTLLLGWPIAGIISTSLALPIISSSASGPGKLVVPSELFRKVNISPPNFAGNKINKLMIQLFMAGRLGKALTGKTLLDITLSLCPGEE